jgi:hypothetical protein
LEYGHFFAAGYEPAEWHEGRSAVRLAFIDHDTQSEGAEPLPAAIQAEVLRLARDIAAGDSNYRLRAAAEVLVRGLSN